MLKKIIKAILLLLVIAIIVFGGMYIGNPELMEKLLNKAISPITNIVKKDVYGTKITKENYNTVGDDLKGDLTENELLYMAYAMMVNALNNLQNQDILNLPENYDGSEANYNKTVGELIEQGKKSMKDNNITPEQWKTQFENQ